MTWEESREGEDIATRLSLCRDSWPYLISKWNLISPSPNWQADMFSKIWANQSSKKITVECLLHRADSVSCLSPLRVKDELRKIVKSTFNSQLWAVTMAFAIRSGHFQHTKHSFPVRITHQSYFPSLDYAHLRLAFDNNFHLDMERAQMSFANKQPPKKKRKSRTAFTNHQIFELEKRFLYQKYLSPADRDEIASTLGLSNAQVSHFYSI